MVKITVDDLAGYCFGVRNAIKQAEAILEEDGSLMSLGHIVHNAEEVKRLSGKGLKVISKEEFQALRNQKALIRAHGEPPSTYETAWQNKLLLIDATCPIVKHLQRTVREQAEAGTETNSQVAIYGKKNHPEVIGLVGHCEGQAFVLQSNQDIAQLDPSKHVHLYAQTTMDPEGFSQIANEIRKYLSEKNPVNTPQLFLHNTICRQVSNRIEHLEKFAASHEVLLFVSGKESSNGRFLFSVCQKANPLSYHIENENDIDFSWFENRVSAGITGATSTPLVQLNQVAEFLKSKV